MGGGSGMFGNSGIISAIRGQEAQAQAPAVMGSATPQATPNVYAPISANSQPQVSPIVQQMADRITMQNSPQMSGLQSLYSQFNMPLLQGSMPRAQVMPMPQYINQALKYRPNMAPAEASLGRVAKSVLLQQKEAAEAELDAMKKMQQAQAQAQAQEQRPGLGSFNN
jgi:hypothetical protein